MSTVTSMQSKNISSLTLAAAIILLLPLAIWAEHRENFTWVNRLIVPTFIQQPNRHTPIVAEGTFLPPKISGATTLTAAQNPVILAGITTIPAGSSLTIQKDVVIYAHEYAALMVEGSLAIQGSAAQPVRLTTNEEHAANQVWAGVITMAGGKTTIDQAQISFASPAISCLAGSIVSVKHTRLADGNTGIWQGSPACTSENVTFKRIRDTITRVNF